MNLQAKRFLSLFLSLSLCGSLLPAAYADSAVEPAPVSVSTERLAASTGWVKNSDGTYSYRVNGEYVTGLQEIGGARYYFNPYTKLMLADDGEYLGGSDGWVIAAADGKLIENGWCTVTAPGPPVGSGIFYMKDYHTLHGLQTIDGKQYFFNTNYGYALVSTKLEVDGVTYRANAEGVLTRLETGDGWHNVDGKTYYYQNGEPVTGKVLEIDGSLYYFDWDGILTTGGKFNTYGPMTVGGGWYYAQEDGKLLRSQWQTEDGARYYYGSDGKMATGLQRIAGSTYYFDDKGALFSGGYISLDGSTYYADANGVLTELQDGWNMLGDERIYLVGGEPLRGEPYEIDGTLYAFDGSGYLFRDGVISLFSNYYLTDADGVIQTKTWYTDADGQRYYFGSDGTAQRGLQTIDGKQYIFADQGLPVMLKDQTVALNGKTYVLGANGEVLSDGWITEEDKLRYLKNGAYLTGLQTIDNTRYLFDDDGYLYQDSLANLGDDWYLAGAEGVLQRNVWHTTEEGETLRIGAQYMALRGLQTIDGKQYIFEAEGLPVLLKAQTLELDGKTYVLDEEGVATLLPTAPSITRQPRNLSVKAGATAVFSLEAEGDALHYQWYSRNPEDEEWTVCGTDSAELRVAAGEANNGRLFRCQVSNTVAAVYSDEVSLTVQQEAPAIGWYTAEDGKRYYYNTDGVMLTDQWLRLNGNSYYFGADGALVTDSWLTDNGVECYVNSRGVKVLNDWADSNGKRYYMDSTGKKLTGQQTIRGQSYFFGDDGVLVLSGWVQSGGKWYHLSSAGTIQKSRWIQLDGNWYFLGADGARWESDWLKDGSSWYWFDADGVMAADVRLTIGGVDYFFDASGAMQTGKWVKVSNSWYYLTGSGATATGWQKISGVWYWFRSDGVMVTGMQDIGGKLYYFTGSGAMQANKWLQNSGNWYYFTGSGAAATGWQKIGGVWYWFRGDGVMVNGWQNINGKMYYFNPSGAMQASKWLQDGGTWYYLTGSGAAATGWLKLNEKWYWFEEDGKMLANTTREIGGKTYTFAGNGVCQN